MQQFQIKANHAGQRFDKFIHKYLPNAGTSFLYKMLRKKNITLNGKKAEGKEILNIGDIVNFFFSDDTFEKFSGRTINNGKETAGAAPTAFAANAHIDIREYTDAYEKLKKEHIDILYEDNDILFLNKPAGVLTQKAKNTDHSLNEWMIGYLLNKWKISAEELTLFKPSVCNRLDRNTTGLVLCGISLKGSQFLSEMVRSRQIRKFYRTICYGGLTEKVILSGSLQKNEKTNMVTISKEGNDIQTVYEPLQILKHNSTYLEVELITGKTHQIRAHLASTGHPLIGDHKYGNAAYNKQAEQKYNQRYQLLHAYRLEFPSLEGDWSYLSNQCFIAPLPVQFTKILEDLS